METKTGQGGPKYCEKEAKNKTPLSIQPVIADLEDKIKTKTLDSDSYSSILKKLRKFNREHLKIFIRSPIFNFIIEFISTFYAENSQALYFNQKNLDHTMSLLANGLSITEARKIAIKNTSENQKYDFMQSIFNTIKTKTDPNTADDSMISLVHRAIRLLANVSMEQELLVFYSAKTIDNLLMTLTSLIGSIPKTEFLIDVVRCIRVLASNKPIRAIIVEKYLKTTVTVSTIY